VRLDVCGGSRVRVIEADESRSDRIGDVDHLDAVLVVGEVAGPSRTWKCGIVPSHGTSRSGPGSRVRHVEIRIGAFTISSAT
jgi:hypothetical protein